jgi:hypothetical protein
VIRTNVIVNSENQFTNSDSVSISDMQKDSAAETQINGWIILPLKESRKVAVGQKVNIRLEDYPAQEFGFIRGRIIRIASTPENGNYLIEVEMPQNMTTSFNIPLKPRREMKGSAEIITEDLRLIQRFINPVKSFLNRRNSHPE